MRSSRELWQSDFFGTLNDMPQEPVSAIAQVLEAMNTETAFRQARKALLQKLAFASPKRILEVECGTGIALKDMEGIPPSGTEIVGLDPTRLFIDVAQERAKKKGLVTLNTKWGRKANTI